MSKREMLINYVPGEECRIAIVQDGRLDEFYQERASTESHVGNIYKGKVTNVEPSIQAAFIDFGLGRNGFLHITDLHPKYFPGNNKEETERVGMKTPRRERPMIQHCLKRGQEVLVQVLKEGIGTKGPTLSSYLSIPGRFLVMMLDMEKLGVSRKIEDDDERHRIRKILDELEPPEGFGFIGRSAATGCTKAELKRDMAYLTRLWKAIDRRRKSLRSVGELYTESDLIIRTIRDIYSSDVQRVIVDHEGAARRARDFLGIASPRAGSSVFLYEDGIPLFHRYSIEEQIEHISARTVPLKSGGSLVIDQTEAVVAIDVNSGRMRDAGDAETTAYRTNLEACDEICRQLRLRDLGGVVINDLIDMRDLKHRRKIQQRFNDNLKDDRARTRVLPISQFGILEMTRQRMRPSLRAATAIDCPGCLGRGTVRSAESVVLDVMRRLAVIMHHKDVHTVELTVSPDVAFVLLNKKRAQLVSLEVRFSKQVMVRVNAGGGIDSISLVGRDERGGMIDTSNLDAPTDSALKKVDAGTSDGDGIVAEEDDQDLKTDEWLDKLDATEQELDAARGVSLGAAMEASDDDSSDDEEEGGRKRKRRRRRGRGGRDGDSSKQGDSDRQSDSGRQGDSGRQDDSDRQSGKPQRDENRSDDDSSDEAGESQSKGDQANQQGSEDGEEEGGRKRGRRRRRGGRGRRRNRDREQSGEQSGEQGDQQSRSSDDNSNDDRPRERRSDDRPDRERADKQQSSSEDVSDDNRSDENRSQESKSDQARSDEDKSDQNKSDQNKSDDSGERLVTSGGYRLDPSLLKSNGVPVVVDEDLSSGPGNIKQADSDDEQEATTSKKPTRGRGRRGSKSSDDSGDKKPKRTRKKTSKKTSSKSGDDDSRDQSTAEKDGGRGGDKVAADDGKAQAAGADDGGKGQKQAAAAEKKEAARRARQAKTKVSPAAAEAAGGVTRPTKVKPQPGRARRTRTAAKEASGDQKPSDDSAKKDDSESAASS